MKKLVFTFLLGLNLLYAQSGLVINEFVANNINTYRDENNNFNDWIEIYNGTGNAIDIGGMYLSDDATGNSKWQIPPGSEPKKYSIHVEISFSGDVLLHRAHDHAQVLLLMHPEYP
jgi:Lamin Tail Domain